MQILYNSDHFAVMQFDLDGPAAATHDAPAPAEALRRGGYEIVDKLSRKEIYLDGALAQQFREKVDALVEAGPTTESIDEFLSGFSDWMHQPLVLH